MPNIKDVPIMPTGMHSKQNKLEIGNAENPTTLKSDSRLGVRMNGATCQTAITLKSCGLFSRKFTVVYLYKLRLSSLSAVPECAATRFVSESFSTFAKKLAMGERKMSLAEVKKAERIWPAYSAVIVWTQANWELALLMNWSNRSWSLSGRDATDSIIFRYDC
jgi:hypothetical protein